MRVASPARNIAPSYKTGRATPSPFLHVCFLVAGQARVQQRLANEGAVVVAARTVRDSGAAVGGDAELGRVTDAAAVHRDRAAPGIANADGVAGIATAVDVADRHRTAIGGSSCDAAVTSRSGICELHDVM